MAEEEHKPLEDDEDELSIEEILSSIRDIISEDDEEIAVDAPEEEAPKAAPKEEEKPKPLPDAPKEEEAEPTELNEVVMNAEDDSASGGIVDLSQDEEESGGVVDLTPDDEDDGEVIELTDPIDSPDESADGIDLDFADDASSNATTLSSNEEEDSDEDVVMQATGSDKTSERRMSSEDLISETAASASVAALSKLSRHVPVETYIEGRNGKVTLEDITREMLRPLLTQWLDDNLPKIIRDLVQKEIKKITDQGLDN